MTLSECTYSIWLMDQSLDLGADETIGSIRVYAPELGLSVGWDVFDPGAPDAAP